MSCRTFRSAVVVLALVSACSSSPPTRFYTLSETAPNVQSAPQAGMGPVRVDRVTIPGELDRPQVVRRVDANRLEIEESDRWAAPLDEMIRRVLTGNLLRRLPGGGGAAPGGPRSLIINISDFYGDAGCNVVLRAAWTRQPASPQPAHPQTAHSTTEEIHVPSIGACPDSLAATMSAALGQLSDRILAGTARQP